MKKPTQHFVGYNPELVKELLNQIEFALDGELEYMHGVFYCFQSAMLGNDYGNFTGMVTGGWYAPEAKEFCEKIITPTAQKSYNNVFQKYINIYNDVVASAKKWGVSTGNVIALPPCPYRPKKLEMITVPPEKDGNVGIDPAIKEV